MVEVETSRDPLEQSDFLHEPDTQVTDFENRVFEEFNPEMPIAERPVTRKEAEQMRTNVEWAGDAIVDIRLASMNRGSDSPEARFGLK